MNSLPPQPLHQHQEQHGHHHEEHHGHHHQEHQFHHHQEHQVHHDQPYKFVEHQEQHQRVKIKTVLFVYI